MKVFDKKTVIINKFGLVRLLSYYELVNMTVKFNFEYNGTVHLASGEAFHEQGKLRYRVAFDSNLIVFHQLPSSIGSDGFPVFVQDVQGNDLALPEERIQEIGLGLEEINFFPGSF